MSINFGKLFNIFDMISNIGRGLETVGNGVTELITEVPVGVFHMGLNGMEFAQYVGVFAFTNLMCIIKNMKNFTHCIFYYIWDVFLQLCYLPITITLFVFSFLIPSIYDIEAKVWDFIHLLDKYWFSFFKFHIIYYPKAIRDKCYNCKRLKPTVFAKKLVEYADDFADPIFGNLTNWITNIVNGFFQVIFSFIDF